MEFQTTINGKEALKLVVVEVKMETEEENKCKDNLQQNLEEVFTRILDNKHASTSNVEE